nr:ATP-binding cassette domain-containing protein [bacterium]
MIQINDLGMKLGKKQVLHHISMELSPGVYGLLGANGSGKTTLLRCMTGIYQPSMGEITYDGATLSQNPHLLDQLGYLPQTYGMFPELTVCEVLEYFCLIKHVPKDKRMQAIDHVLEMVNLTQAKHARVSTLSGGMNRRVGIAQAILGNARVILLDEPTSGLDPEERMRFQQVISQIRGDKTIIISTHIVEDVAAGCDGVLVLDQGNLLYNGTQENLLSRVEGLVYTVDRATLEEATFPYYIVHSQPDSHRIVTHKNDTLSRAEPTLEDAYLALTKGLL